MREFEHQIGEMVAHKHWHIHGRVRACKRAFDFQQKEFRVYIVAFNDPSHPHNQQYNQQYSANDELLERLTEFELTKPHPHEKPTVNQTNADSH